MEYYTSGKLTHGGYPIAEAWEWEERTYQLLGDILFGLYTQDVKKRWKAHNDYYNLRNHFVLKTFEAVIDGLDEKRTLACVTPMREMIANVAQEMVHRKEPILPDEPKVMPKLDEVVRVEHVSKIDIKKPVLKVECEQMSLF